MNIVGRYAHRNKQVIDRWVRHGGKRGMVIEVHPKFWLARERVRELNLKYNRERIERGMRYAQAKNS